MGETNGPFPLGLAIISAVIIGLTLWGIVEIVRHL